MRLIIVFILTVIVSGGILTYLSINSISSFKELTEKKIFEEQEKIAAQISSHFYNALQETVEEFTGQVFTDVGIDWHALRSSDSLQWITTPFVLDGAKEFQWPWYLEDPEISSRTDSRGFHQEFSKGERAEFQQQNTGQAATFYRSALRRGQNSSDSAQAYNALGRVSLKLKRFDEAIEYYSGIISSHSSILDQNGFPYAYYATLNLLNLPDPSHKSIIHQNIHSFLSGLVGGTIPLSISTEEILTQIVSWEEASQLDENFVQTTRDQTTFCWTGSISYNSEGNGSGNPIHRRPMQRDCNRWVTFITSIKSIQTLIRFFLQQTMRIFW